MGTHDASEVDKVAIVSFEQLERLKARPGSVVSTDHTGGNGKKSIGCTEHSGHWLLPGDCQRERVKVFALLMWAFNDVASYV